MTSPTNTTTTSAPTTNPELQNTDPLIKTDCLGRILIRPEHREALLDKFEQGTLSAQQFAKQHGIKYTTFATWNQKRKRQQGAYPNKLDSKDTQLINSLTEVVALGQNALAPKASNTTSGINVKLGGKAEISLHDETQIALAAKLILALESHVS